MIRFTVPTLRREEELLRQSTRQVIALLRDLRPLWGIVGRRIARHIDERARNPDVHARPLAQSTQDARVGGWGYYRRRQTWGPFGSEARSIWWTGRSIRFATSEQAWRSSQRQLTYDFGRGGRRRDLIRWMHDGGPNRPDRPVYDEREVRRIADDATENYLEVVLSGGGTFRLTGGSA